MLSYEVWRRNRERTGGGDALERDTWREIPGERYPRGASGTLTLKVLGLFVRERDTRQERDTLEVF